ncbi:MAG: RNA polymerase sigma factor SigZ [bacterium]|nr:RNA polymerase sigma factor SigZ [bacterium]
MDEFLNQLWQKFHKALLNFIKKNISNSEDAEDLLQNVFLKIHTNIHQLKEKEKVTSWLYQITRNAIYDSFRINGKQKVDILPLMDGRVGHSDDSHDDFWKQEILSCLMEMIEELPEKYRSVLKLYEFDGLSHKEIAQRLGISVSGSKSRVQRSKEKLKEVLVCGCRTEASCLHLVKMGQSNYCSKQTKQAS